MEKIYKEAFAEVDEILKIMPIDLISKIPAQFRQIISENKAENYKIDLKEPLDEEQLKQETVVILGLIYRDFLASPEEREELQLKDAEELKKIEHELKEQYDMEKVFDQKKTQNNYENNDDSKSLIVYKETNFLEKLLNLIKRIFNKK